MDPEDLTPEEAHPWLDEPDDLTLGATMPQTVITVPYHDPGGQTVPAFTHDSGALALPAEPPDHPQRALAVYAVCVLVCLTGLFAMFFVFGGRFLPAAPPRVIFVASRAIPGGQTGDPPTPSPRPRIIVHPLIKHVPAQHQPASIPVSGIRPARPIPISPLPPNQGSSTRHHPTPIPTDPTKISQSPTEPPAVEPVTVSPSSIKLACAPQHSLAVPGNIAFTIYNPSAEPLGWNIITTSGAFDISATRGILAPDASRQIVIADVATSGSLVVSTTLGDFPVTISVC